MANAEIVVVTDIVATAAVASATGKMVLSPASVVATPLFAAQQCPRIAEQYALRAAQSGWYPVVQRRINEPVAMTWLEKARSGNLERRLILQPDTLAHLCETLGPAFVMTPSLEEVLLRHSSLSE